MYIRFASHTFLPRLWWHLGSWKGPNTSTLSHELVSYVHTICFAYFSAEAVADISLLFWTINKISDRVMTPNHHLSLVEKVCEADRTYMIVSFQRFWISVCPDTPRKDRLYSQWTNNKNAVIPREILIPVFQSLSTVLILRGITAKFLKMVHN